MFLQSLLTQTSITPKIIKDDKTNKISLASMEQENNLHKSKFLESGKTGEIQPAETSTMPQVVTLRFDSPKGSSP